MLDALTLTYSDILIIFLFLTGGQVETSHPFLHEKHRSCAPILMKFWGKLRQNMYFSLAMAYKVVLPLLAPWRTSNMKRSGKLSSIFTEIIKQKGNRTLFPILPRCKSDGVKYTVPSNGMSLGHLTNVKERRGTPESWRRIKKRGSSRQWKKRTGPRCALPPTTNPPF